MRRDRRRKDDTMRIQLSDHFTYKKIWRFSLPPIVMMVFTSIYGVVDGLFVSNFVGKVPFAAINLVMPFIMILGGFGFMIGTGGSALVAKTMGEGDKHRANQYFTMIIAATLICGALEKAGLCEIPAALEQVLEIGKSFFVSLKEADVATSQIAELLASALNRAFSAA